MHHPPLLSLCLILILALSPPAIAEKVALRAANGRFLYATDDGTLRAGISIRRTRRLSSWFRTRTMR